MTMLVQETEEFLRDFSLVEFENRHAITIFRALVQAGPPTATQIGDQSAVGTVYRLGNRKIRLPVIAIWQS